MKTVLITGGAGYVGAHAAKAFSESGWRIVVLDNLVYGHKDFARWGDFVKGDIGDKKLLESLFSRYKFDLVSHFAAYALVGESVLHPEKYYINNIIKAEKLLSQSVKAGVKALQFSSTCAVYGIPKAIPITEDHGKDPISPYGRTKLFFEGMLEDYSKAHGLSYSVLRYFNASGASEGAEIGEDHNPETHLIPLVLDTAIQRRPHIEIFGDTYETPDGTCIRDYIHVMDLARAHVLAAEKILNTGISSIYNLGNGEGFSVKEVIDTAKRITGKEITVVMGKPRQGDPPRLIGSSERIKKELKWNPQYASLDKIIESAWKWHRERFR